ncbi:MAG: type IV secretion system DNA-binding domain-containing protein, partial [Eubacterium sp.]|nr:type IV secretion system DNA-binding domain-containing protein [Eubacterium sp.]
HTIILGPTGSGKSTAMEHLILSDIYAGRSVLALDPKNDLVSHIRERVPEGRMKDVVVIDPSDPCPVGFNPLALPGDPTLIADSILAVFKEIFAENWGIRSQDVLSAALLTLMQTKGASLLWLPALLTDENFRHSITDKLTDEIVLKPFWKNYDAMKDSERKQEIAPVLNKMRQFLYRPGLRSVLGQSNPKFQLTDLLYKRKIVLVPLNKGLVGAESARLLGSLIVGLTWTLALSRASIPPEKRHIISMYIDELQDYLALPTNLSDALAQARGLGVGITMAHQYRSQLLPDIRAGIDANARNKIVFGLNAGDAKEMAAMSPELTALDFITLPRYEIYTNFMSEGTSTGWIRGVTLPPMDSLREPADLKALSQTTYGVPAEVVDKDFLKLLKQTQAEPPSDFDDSAIGRRKL